MRSPGIRWLAPGDPPDAFPDLSAALDEPDGLLAVGGDLSMPRLLYAYAHGIFPWYDEGQAILWWSPDPRCILEPSRFHVSRRLRRVFRNGSFAVTFNRDFGAVVDRCAGARPGQRGTWITRDMKAAYRRLHGAGWAHSVEVWDGDSLAGGLYGVAIGRGFFGESMFSGRPNGSKAAMLALCRELDSRGWPLLDCQVVSPHLLTLGASTVPRDRYAAMLAEACDPPAPAAPWPAGLLRVADMV